MAKGKIKVVVADDSAFMRKKISEILNSDPQIEVIAMARDGRDALEAVHALKPDVVTLDVEMPVLDGMDALGYIMSEIPTPCIMISAYTEKDSKISIKALEYGAVDYVFKPDGVISRHIDNLASEIIEKVKIAARVDIKNLKLIIPEKRVVKEAPVPGKRSIKKVFAIASSTGGTQALSAIIPELSADLSACILVVQHMPEGFTKQFAERINSLSNISVKEAEDGMPLEPGSVIIARGGKHMRVKGSKEDAKIVLSDEDAVKGLKPSADIMMQSVAEIFGEMSVGLVLTGMGSDGTEGSKIIKTAGGMIIAEDEKSCVVYGMPRSVIVENLADTVLKLSDISQEIEKLSK